MNDIFDYDEYESPKKDNVLLDTNNSKNNKSNKNKDFNKSKNSNNFASTASLCLAIRSLIFLYALIKG